MGKATNVTWHDQALSKEDRRKLNEHQSAVIWFTGLSGSGKSTVANALAQKLHERKVRNYVLDGDNIRHGLNKNLGFSEEDRKENIRRIGEVARLFVDSGQFAITAFISPYREDRSAVRDLLETDEFIEVFVDCPLTECESRDPKGLYQKARSGEIPEFTGISAPYEAPENPEVVIETHIFSPDECADQVIDYLRDRKLI